MTINYGSGAPCSNGKGFEPGWLMRTCHEAHISVMSTQMPDAVRHIYATPLPIPESEARELYEKMDARFRAWTGMGLAQWQGEHHGRQD